MKRRVAIFLIIIFIFSTKAYAEDNKYKAAILMEANSGKILFEYNKDAILPQASITKLMTYFVFKDFMNSKNISPNTTIKVDLRPSDVPAYWSKLGLKYGQEVNLNELLQSLLIVSAGDSALELQRFYNTDGKNIIAAMNEKALETGMYHTKYINVTGISEDSSKKIYNYSTVYDTALLSMKLLNSYPEILKITSMKNFNYHGINVDNTNQLLKLNPLVDGLKTGYTSDAGYCLVSTEDITSSNGNGKPFRLLAVVFGCKTSKDRLDESVRLMKYGEENFINAKVIDKNKIYSQPNEYYKNGSIEASSNEDAFLLKNKNDKILEKFTFDKQLPMNIKAGDKIGTIKVTDINSNVTLVHDLFATKNFDSVSIFKRIWLYILNMFNKVR